MKTTRIVIMAKAPRAGLAKSRLIPVLGAEGAAQLATRMLDHTLNTAVEANIGPVELCRTPFEDPAWEAITLPQNVTVSNQGEGDLGDRMARVSERVISAGESLILIGTDCPFIDAARLRRIAEALQHADAVMNASADGGYVALGLNRHDARIFADIDWGTDSVAYRTLWRMSGLGWSVRMLPMLRDIDEPDDLASLPDSWQYQHV